MKNIFITGISSGIGKGVALYFAEMNYKVYGISRRELDYSHPNIHHQTCDILDFEASRIKITKLLGETELEIVLLNAGILGKISTLKESKIKDLENTMHTNLWAQKNLIDLFLGLNNIKTIMAISSGAAIKGTPGWSGYSLSKAALNMLIQLYASENPSIKFIALAPGLVDTNMQEYISTQIDLSKFPNFKRLKDARGTQAMPSIEDFGKLFYSKLDQILKTNSGEFIDLRNI